MSLSYYIPSFAQGSPLHGGTLRTMQIREVLNDQLNGLKEIQFEYELELSKLFVIRPSVNSISKIRDGLSVAGAYKLASLAAQVHRLVHKNSTVYLEVCGINSILLGHALLAHDCRVICFPHNIEALVAGTNTRLVKDEFCWMRLELELYRAAIAVYTISEFDRAAIACLGADSCCFPYFPNKDRLKWLEGIRRERKNKARANTLLLFTSVNNPPTKRAVAKFLDDFRSKYISSSYRLIVAGRGTQIFQSSEDQKIKVLGEVEEKVAESLQNESDISLVPVIQTSGFLTKLIENNLMAIPTLVLGSYLQAQNLSNFGILYCSDTRELIASLSILLKNEQEMHAFKKPTLIL